MAPPRALIFVVLLALKASAAADSLKDDDKFCFYTSRARCGAPRMCNACLNDPIPDASGGCFLSATGMCLAMSSYDAAKASEQFPAATTNYCANHDAVCRECLSTDNSTVCVGADGACVCVAACESVMWRASVKALANADDSDDDSETQVDTNASANGGSSSNAPVIIVLVIACGVGALIAFFIHHRKRDNNGATKNHPYRLAATPTMDAKLPAKPV